MVYPSGSHGVPWGNYALSSPFSAPCTDFSYSPDHKLRYRALIYNSEGLCCVVLRRQQLCQVLH